MFFWGAIMNDRASFTNFPVFYPYLKRVVDTLASIIVLLLISPLLLAIALAVAVSSKGSILFWSQRQGKNRVAFPMLKFRTMTINSKIMSREILSEADFTFTPIGRFLRKTSLDELPQFWNVIKGDMSLIGPRPLLVDDYANEQRDKYPEIYSVKPGITGLAQVNGRNFITPKNKVRYDSFYANRMCLLLDLKIIIKTFSVIFNTKLVR